MDIDPMFTNDGFVIHTWLFETKRCKSHLSFPRGSLSYFSTYVGKLVSSNNHIKNILIKMS